MSLVEGDTGLLVRPEAARRQMDAEAPPEAEGPVTAGAGGDTSTGDAQGADRTGAAAVGRRHRSRQAGQHGLGNAHAEAW